MRPALPYLSVMSAATRLADRALLRLSGPDVRGFLQGLVTNDVAGPLPCWAALLSAQGKALFDFLIWADGDDLLIDCEAEQADALARRLTLYRLRRPIVIARDESMAVHWAPDGAVGRPDPRLPALGRRWLAAAPGAPMDDAPMDESLADEAWRAHRLRLGVTEGIAELGTDRTLWLEANAAELDGVSFSKGCYVGQENTARMNWRQKVNRRLVVVPTIQENDRTRIVYPELGLAVEHRRIDAIAGAIVPDWLAAALATPSPD